MLFTCHFPRARTAALTVLPDIDRDGNQEPLRFPLFHREMLEQSRWGASDLNGRIVIMITEGFARPNRSPPIERVRDLIAFSFLHAPQSKSPISRS